MGVCLAEIIEYAGNIFRYGREANVVFKSLVFEKVIACFYWSTSALKLGKIESLGIFRRNLLVSHLVSERFAERVLADRNNHEILLKVLRWRLG